MHDYRPSVGTGPATRALRTLLLALVALCYARHTQAQSLEEQLKIMRPAELADLARQQGDAVRGAVVFYQPHMACLKCHTLGDAQPSALGPDLTALGKEATDEALVDAVLSPSKVIRKGFEPVTVVTTDGKTLVGILVEKTPERVVIRDVQKSGEPTTIAATEVEEVQPSATSIMPAGQVNQLASRQQFLDLIRYLMEVRDGGAARAKELEPPQTLLTLSVPEYEEHLDHAGLIASWNADSLKRGEAIYQRVCANCHGTHDRPGSLPTSLRFAEGKFKNGSDPLSMYRTLTRGFGLMAAQSWMVPSQKYDVIHYIREAYIKQRNPTQFVAINAGYLKSLPPGDTRGPEPSLIEPWSAMDYGPSLTHTYEIPGDALNIAYKGIAIRLDAGAGGVARGRQWLVFDTDTLRTAAAWSADGQQPENFIDWQGIQFNGAHGIHPRIVGKVAYANAIGPGWADPRVGSFDDVDRVVGRDGRRYGPLPRAWAKYRGRYDHGQQVVLSYTVGNTEVLESPRLVTRGESQSPLMLRTLNVGPREHELVLQVAELAAVDSASIRVHTVDRAVIVVTPPADKPSEAQEQPFAFDGRHYLEPADAAAFDTNDKDFTIMAKLRTRVGGTIFAAAQPGPKWTPDSQSFFVRDGRLGFDVGWVAAVTGKTEVDDGKLHTVAACWEHESQKLRLYVDGKLDGEGRLAPKAKLPEKALRIGFTAPDFPQPETYFQGEIAEVRFYQQKLTSRLDDMTWPQKSNPALLARWLPSDVQAAKVRNTAGKAHDAVVCHRAEPKKPPVLPLVAGFSPANTVINWSVVDGRLLLKLPAGEESLLFSVWLPATPPGGGAAAHALAGELAAVSIPNADADLSALTHGGPPRWPQKLETQAAIGAARGPFAVDVLTAPEANPWLAQTRFTGLDFFADGRIAVCSWDGDVWIVEQLAQETLQPAAAEKKTLRWQRIASGMFQPLGLKIIDETIHVTCRDQLVVLHDLNGDGEIDYYQCLNNDHQVTEHFHEFAMGLQVDAEGDFYYAKSARHALPAVVPHHGTLLRVSKDGSRTDIIANGFRAANGVCLNPDGSFVVTDQEGHWNPKNRINWVTVEPDGKPHFYGNMFGYHDVTDNRDSAMVPPLCWITNAFDRSPAELLWVDSRRWGPLDGALLNLSYGYGKVFVVPHEKVNGLMQGGMIELPIPNFPTGVMRGRFHPDDGQLYLCGMFAWAGNATQPGGLYRLRATGEPMHLPTALHATKTNLQLTFSDPLEAKSLDAKNLHVKTWSLKRSADYGSDHYDEKDLKVLGTALSSDGKTLSIAVDDLRPTWCMEIKYSLKFSDGKTVSGVLHNTIHELGD